MDVRQLARGWLDFIQHREAGGKAVCFVLPFLALL